MHSENITKKAQNKEKKNRPGIYTLTSSSKSFKSRKTLFEYVEKNHPEQKPKYPMIKGLKINDHTVYALSASPLENPYSVYCWLTKK